VAAHDGASADSTRNRAARVASRTRKPSWDKAPLRILRSECIVCDECVRACPAGFGAIFRHGVTLVIVPELCSGCDKCVRVCPVDCIVDDPDWVASPPPWWAHAGAPDDPYLRRTTGPSAGVAP
jgi:H+/Na+-translocating ferredoxin:NAD+ oxidoreductase subunit B